MPFMRALAAALDGLVFRAALPVWLASLTSRGREALLGYDEMEVGHLSKHHACPDLVL